MNKKLIKEKLFKALMLLGLGWLALIHLFFAPYSQIFFSKLKEKIEKKLAKK